jgi:hypothetical protein
MSAVIARVVRYNTKRPFWQTGLSGFCTTRSGHQTYRQFTDKVMQTAQESVNAVAFARSPGFRLPPLFMRVFGLNAPMSLK